MFVKGTPSGITMNQYLELYEQSARRQVKAADRRLFNQLTTNTLFCEYCYRPFSTKNIEKELTTPYIALLDIISALTFVFIPITWIPLILLFSIFAIKDYVFGLGDHAVDNINTETNFSDVNFDAEYFPERYETR
eukprot:146701_1